MQAYKKLSALFIIVCLVSLLSVGVAQEAAPSQQEPVAAGSGEEGAPAFPYVAEITGDNVNVRSGPGTNYYRSGELDTGARVKVVASKFSWSQIVPPEGSFSWISKQYVSLDTANPTVGTVTGDNVRVYAGSPYREPIHSDTPQLKLNTGDKVKLMGEEKDDYYKIVPPSGAYLWVSTKYTEPLGPVGEVPLVAEKPAEAEGPTAKADDLPTDIRVETMKLKEYYDLQKQSEAERAKPLEQQNYTAIKRALLEMAKRKESGKAARYAEFAVGQIERYELALSVGEELKLQDEHLKKIHQRIEKNRIEKLAQVKELGRFTVIGQFQTSNIYDPLAEPIRYRIIDDSGRTACYAVARGSAAGMNLSQFVGRKVGLKGTIEPHPQTKGALLTFTEIEELK
ncbi:MAG: SH3 domain-containing protein [Planctomycetota bacterium]|nr:MAG: SH3 domain-containing protein [Planctomycetota bacterium]